MSYDCKLFVLRIVISRYNSLLRIIIRYLKPYSKKVKLANLVKGDPKAPFSIVTTLRCRGGCYSIPWKVKFATLVEGDLKAPFSIATMPRCRGQCYSISWKVKLATLVEGDPKAPFLIATTLRCKEGCYFIPWIASLYP